MGQLYSNIAIGFDIYLTFFPIFLTSILAILGSSVPMGLIAGFYYKLSIKR